MNIYNEDFLEKEFDGKFDVIVQNPPYQELKEGNKKSKAIWDKFVKKALDICIEGGYMVAVHPGGWRNFGGKFKGIQDILTEREILYLNINTYKNGLDVFKAKTDYDFYCVRNVKNTLVETKIITIDNEVEFFNLKDTSFIPSCNISEVYSLVAKEGEEKLNILFNSSYHHQRPHMNKDFSDEFRFLCLQNINIKDEISCIWYSNTNERGHFGVPKVVFGRKSSGVYVDSDGVYGLAEDCGAIIDDSDNLEKIKIALKNNYFIKNIMGFRDNLGDKYNKKVLSTFRKDFWKEFLD